jgi:hypothetical protein
MRRGWIQHERAATGTQYRRFVYASTRPNIRVRRKPSGAAPDLRAGAEPAIARQACEKLLANSFKTRRKQAPPARIRETQPAARRDERVKLLRLASWMCVVLLAVLSLVPGDMLVRTGAPGIAEHVIAYGATAALFTLAYPAVGRIQLMLWLVGYAAVLEIAQAYVPGRHATLYDFTGGVGGVVLGCLIGTFLLRKSRPENKP